MRKQFFDDHHHDLDKTIFLAEINRTFAKFLKENNVVGGVPIEMKHLAYWLRMHETKFAGEMWQ